MTLPVNTVTAGGLPVVDVTATTPKMGMPVSEAAPGKGTAVTKVAAYGVPVTFVAAWSYPTVPTSSTDTWNPADLNSMSLSGGNMVAATNFTSGTAVRAIRGATGKFYFEGKWTGAGAGISNGGGIGVALLSAPLTGAGGITSAGTNAAMGCLDGSMFINGSFLGGNIGAVILNSVNGVAVDTTNLKIWFRLNGGNWNGSGTANPATNVGGMDISFLGGNPAYPLAAPIANGGQMIATVNFGATAFAFTPPAGFSAGPL